MPIGFSSPARNLFLLGGSGEGIVTNFFRAIARNNNENTIQVTANQYVDTTKTFYTGGDNRYLSSAPTGSANRRYGFVEERDIDGLLGNKVEIAPTVANTDLDLTDFIVDSSDNIVACGFTPDTGWIAKYDDAGTLVWSSTSNTGDAKYRAVAEASDGTYYVCGTIQGDFENDEVNTRSIIEKFDSDGNPLWGKQISIADGFVIARGIALNSNDEIYVCGYVEDDTIKASLVKLSAIGEILWDRTFESHEDGIGILGGYKAAGFYDITIDGKDQIFLVGSLLGTSLVEDGIIVKLNPQGNIEWQRQTTGEDVRYQRVKSDSETGQTIVAGIIQHDTLGECGIITKYSGNGTVVFRRLLRASEANSPTNAFDKMALDADPSYYYLAFTDRGYSSNGAPDNDRYIYGRVSTSGNGLGDFEYEFDGNNRTIDYVIDTIEDRIGRLDDGSVRNDTSDLVTYPFGANDLVFDDYSTVISNKKAQISEPNIYTYSGSPSVRPADFQELNLLGEAGIFSESNSTTIPNDDLTIFSTNPRFNFTSGLNGTLDIELNSSNSSEILDFITNAKAGDTLSGVETWNYASTTITLTGSFTESPTNTWSANATSDIADQSGFLGYNRLSLDSTTNGGVPMIATLNTTRWDDQSGKGNNGVVNGATHNAAGYWEFDGVDDYITTGITAAELLGIEFTVEAWINPSSFANSVNEFLRVDKSSGVRNWGLYVNSSGQLRKLGTGGDQNASYGTLSTNTWYHIVMRHSVFSIFGANSLSSYSIYLNGTLVVGGDNDDYDNVNAFGNLVVGNSFTGEIGEVRVYPRALTAAQVFQNYNATKTKYTNEAPDTAPKIGPSIVYGSNLLLNYDFGNRACYERTNQNLVPYSQGDNWISNWTNVSATILSTTERSPVGTNDAVKYTGTGFALDVSMTSGKTYVWSLYVKVVDAAGDTIKTGHGASQYGSSGNSTANIRYNLSDWSKEYAASGDNAYIYDAVPVGDGWYRIGGKAYKGDANQGQFEIYIGNMNATVIVWGPQLEEWDGIGVFDSLPPKASRYFGTTGTTVNNVPTTVKNLSSTSYTNTIPSGVVYNSGVLEHNQVPLIFSPGVSHNSNTNGFTWEIWMALDSTPTGSAYIFSADSNNLSTSEGLRIDNNRSVWFQRNNNGATGVGVTVVLGNWNHFVITMTGPQGLTYIYHNGTEELVNNGTSAFDPQQLSSVGSSLFTGKVAEIRVYDRALSGTEVSQNFNATRGKYGV